MKGTGMKFRKKPVVIEAVQLTWSNWNEICDFVPKSWFVRRAYVDPVSGEETKDATGKLGLLMKTQNTETFMAVENDWIIKGVAGEFYPCKPDIFEATYEPVETGPNGRAAAQYVVGEFVECHACKVKLPKPSVGCKVSCSCGQEYFHNPGRNGQSFVNALHNQCAVCGELIKEKVSFSQHYHDRCKDKPCSIP